MIISVTILFICCASIQVGFWIFLFSKLAFYKGDEQSNCEDPQSLIVCYKNESESIPLTLPSLIAQNKPHLEIITIDDFSTDNTLLKLNAFKTECMIVLSADNDRPGKKSALSSGIKQAGNEILLFTDADCIPSSSDWAQIMSNHSKKHDIVLGYSPSQKRSGILNYIVRYETWLTAIQYLSYALARIPYMGVGRNLLYRKSAFLKHNGFEGIDTLASGDDDLMVSKMANKTNTTICINSQTFVYSFSPVTLIQWIKQKSRHISTAMHYKPKTKFLLSIFSLTHILFYSIAVIGLITMTISPAIIVCTLIIKWILQSLINYPAMKILKERDLWIWFPFLDFFMALFYLFLSPYLILKDKSKWN